MIYIVLGMHKSGTTMMTKMLHKSGIDMGDFDYPIDYDKGNKYERFDFYLFNICMLDIPLNAHSINVVHKITTPSAFVYPLFFTDVLKKNINHLNELHENWGFKDPRTCLTYKVWATQIPQHKVICVFRNPFDLIKRYSKDLNKFRVLYKLTTKIKTLKAWYIYNKNILEYYEESSQEFIFIDYNDFLTNSENQDIMKLSKFCNREILDIRDKKLYRNRSDNLTIWGKLEKFILKLLVNRDIDALHEKLKKLV